MVEKHPSSDARHHEEPPIPPQEAAVPSTTEAPAHVDSPAPAPTRSANAKRRKRWENEEEFNERQTQAQAAQHSSLEDELRMIAQTSASELDAPTHFAHIPQEPIMPAVIPNRSKWDDEDEA